MGSTGKMTSNENATPVEVMTTPSVANNVRSYDIEDEAERKGYNSAAEMIQEDLTADNEFWTRDSEMVESVEDLGYSVISSPNGETFTIMDDNDDSDSEFIVSYERAGSSRYITGVRKA